MPRPIGSTKNPTYRLHKPSGQAVVTIDGKDFYLGKHDTEASRTEYDRLVGEWMSGGRRLNTGKTDLLVVEFIAGYWQHARGYYGGEGKHPGELQNIKLALVPLKRLYGHTKVESFGPLALKAVRLEMTKAGWCRTYINSQIGRIKRAFKWAVEEELISGTIFHALQAVGGLKRGRTEARESEPVVPVLDADVQAVRGFVAPQIRTMIDLQLLTGMRPGEVCDMRTRDIDTTGPLWVYQPASHKTEHHGHERIIYLGPKAQEVVGPWLRTELEAYIFSPKEADAWRREQRRNQRKTPLSCGNRAGSNRKRSPKRQPGGRYYTRPYYKAIQYACDRTFPAPEPLAHREDETRREWMSRLTDEQKQQLKAWQKNHRWHPHQLRHNAATRLRQEYGLEAAQVILGHKTLSVTQVYAEKNVAAAKRVMAEVG